MTKPRCGRCGLPRQIRCTRPDCVLPEYADLPDDEEEKAAEVMAAFAVCIIVGFVVGWILGFASDHIMQALANLLEVL